jgi:hypothetical protein
MSRRRLFEVLVAAIVTICLLVFTGTLSAQGNSDQAFERVREVQERHTDELMAKEGVVGTAVGLNDQGKEAVLVLLERPGVGGIPQELEGVPVHPLVTGKISALNARAKGKPGPRIDPTARFERPVPIGVSTGNANENSAGTIACRVKDSAGNVYALSNNHVYALENTAHAGDEVLQPGRYDGGIPGVDHDHLGSLYAWVGIIFSTSASNTVDAAIAASDTSLLGNATPADGYGTPQSQTIVAATIGMAVQKYGRTTSLTKGTVTGINATIPIGYTSGTAQFVKQIIVQSRSPFIKAGDSGSLLVTNDGNKNPVGLVFAGNNAGNYAVANPIDLVLDALGGLTVDGSP